MLAAMRKLVLPLLLALFLNAGLTTSPTAQHTSQARLLSLDAGLKFAESLTLTDPQARRARLDEAAALLQRLLEDYPDSEEARRLSADEVVAGVSLKGLEAARARVLEVSPRLAPLSKRERGACFDRPNVTCLFDMAVDAGRGLDRKEERYRVLAAIARARGQVGEFARALDLARLIPNDGPEGEGFRAIADIAAAQALTGVVEAPLGVAESLPARQQRGRIRLAAVEGLLAQGERERAESLIGTMQHRASRAQALAVLADFLGEEDEAAAAEARGRAVDLANSLSRRSERDGVLSALVALETKAGRLSEALVLIGSILDRSLRERTIRPLAQAFAAAGDIDAALQLAERVKADGPRARLLAELAGERASVDQLAEAIALLDRIQEPLARAGALSKIAALPLSVEQGRALFEAAPGFTRAPDGAWALAIAARTVSSHGDSESSAAMIAETSALLETLEPWDRVPADLELAAALIESGQDEAAAERLGTLPEGAVWYEGVAALARALAAMTDRESASRLLQAFAAELDRAKMSVAVSSQLAESGAVDEALSMAAAIERPRERDFAFFGVAKAQLLQGDSKAARATFERAESLRADPFLRREFAVAQAAAGDLRGAARSVVALEDQVGRAEAFKAVAVTAAGAPAPSQ